MFSNIMQGDVLRSFVYLSSPQPEMQLAVYTGDGRGYVRHRDSLPVDPHGTLDEAGKMQRRLTTIVYANQDW